MQSPTFQTMSSKLEQFLYAHGIRFSSTHSDADGMQVWVYKLTPETQRVVDEFRELFVKKNGRKA